MAQIGQKRPVQEADSASEIDSNPKDDTVLMSLSKRPAPSPSFSFRPSSLQSATRGFSLRQSSLRPAGSEITSPSIDTSSASSASPGSDSRGEQTPCVEKSGFLKLNQESIKMVDVSVLASDKPVMTTAGTSEAVTVSSSRNPFTQSEKSPTLGFASTLESKPPEQNYFSVPDQSKGVAVPSPVEGGGTLGNQGNGDDGVSSTTSGSNAFNDAPKASPDVSDNRTDGDSEQPIFGSNSRQLVLPEVHAFTGEESEKNIVVISARLYIFEGDTRTWKERGRGEVRLNDSAKDEGVFQSRLVMRASGSYRVLLNTHLWAQMSCDRANQKSLRVTAQHITSTDDIGVYLITGAAKDIQQLFTAIDRRIQALKRNVDSEKESDVKPTNSKSADDEEEDKDESLSHHSSPVSSPESIHVRQVERPPTISVSDADKVQRSLKAETTSKEVKDESKKSSSPGSDEDTSPCYSSSAQHSGTGAPYSPDECSSTT